MSPSKDLHLNLNMRDIAKRSDAEVVVEDHMKFLWLTKLGIKIMRLGIWIIGFNGGDVKLNLKRDKL